MHARAAGPCQLVSGSDCGTVYALLLPDGSQTPWIRACSDRHIDVRQAQVLPVHLCKQHSMCVLHAAAGIVLHVWILDTTEPAAALLWQC